ncbi:hypothetical protein BDV3_002977 [Batrachochytrium dendrobatidis]
MMNIPWLVETVVPLSCSKLVTLNIPSCSKVSSDALNRLLYAQNHADGLIIADSTLQSEGLDLLHPYLTPLTGTYYLSHSPNCFIYWRLCPGRCSLELKRIFLSNAVVAQSMSGSNSFNQTNDLSESSLSETTLVLEFSEPCLPCPGFFQDSDTLSVHVKIVTICGSFYNIELPFPHLSCSDSLSIDNVVSYSSSLFSTLERVPVLVHFPDADMFTVACGNGSLVHVTCPPMNSILKSRRSKNTFSNDSNTSDDADMDESDDPYRSSYDSGFHQVELVEATYMSHFKSLARTPSKLLFSALRSVVSADSNDMTNSTFSNEAVKIGPLTSPQQVISIASLCLETQLLLFTFCRDSRLRIWSAVTKQCIKNIQIGIACNIGSKIDVSISTGAYPSTPGLARSNSLPATSRQPLLPATPCSAIKVFRQKSFNNNAMTQVDGVVMFNLACYLPQTTTGGQATFIIYSGTINSMGELVHFEPIHSQNSGSDGQEYLVDFTLSPSKNGDLSASCTPQSTDQSFEHDTMDMHDVKDSSHQLEFGNKMLISNSAHDSETESLGEAQWWTLWTVWDRSCASVIRYIQIDLPAHRLSNELHLNHDRHSSSQFESSHDQPAYGLVVGHRWMIVTSCQQESTELPTIDAFDDEMMDANSYLELFMEHIFEPGRFSLALISEALDIYSGADPYKFCNKAGIATPDLLYADVFHRAITTIGCTIDSDFEEQNAGTYFTSYNLALLGAYNTFLSILVQRHQLHSAPAGIVFNPYCNTIMTLQRGPTMGFLRVADAYEVMTWGHSMSQSTPADNLIAESPLSLLAGDQLFTGHLKSIRSKSLRTDLFHFIQLLNFVNSELFPPGFAMATETEILTTRASSDSVVDDYAFTVYSRLSEQIEPEDLAEKLVTLEQLTKNIGHFQLLITTLLDILAHRAMDEKNRDESGTDVHSFPWTALNTTLSDGKGTNQDGINNASLFTNSIIATAASQIVSMRLKVIRQSVMALLVLKALNLNDLHHYDVPSSVMRKYLDVFSALSLMQWLSVQQVLIPSHERDSSTAHHYPTLSRDVSKVVVSSNTVTKEHKSLILHLLQHHYIIDVNLPLLPRNTSTGSDLILSTTVTVAAESFLSCLGFIGDGGSQQMTHAVVVLSRKLMAFGYFDIVGKLFPPHMRFTPAIEYINARVWLDVLEWEKSARCFCLAVGGDPTQSDLSLVFSPHSLTTGYGEYYRHVAGLFYERDILDHTVVFAKLAIGCMKNGDQSAEVKGLVMLVFKCCVDMGDFDAAYEAILSNPDSKSQRDCLRTFVNALCSANDMHGLCAKYNFGHLSSEVERTLEFKARTGDVTLSKHTPNYYCICYTFYIYRGDFRRAAMAMYALAHRLSSIQLPPLNRIVERAQVVIQIVTEQAQHLLAALNCLKLVDAEYAWLSVPLAMAGPIDRAERNATYPTIDLDALVTTQDLVMSDTYTSNVSNTSIQPLHIIEIEDITKQYHLTLAKLNLYKRFPDLAQNTFFVQPGDALNMYCQVGLFDSAVSFAFIFGLGIEKVIVSLIHFIYVNIRQDRMGNGDDNCNGCDLDEEVGSYTKLDRWTTLRVILQQYDKQANAYAYHLTAITTILKQDKLVRLPLWLTQPFESYQSDRLIRIYLLYDRVADAAKLSCRYIEEETARLPDGLGAMSGKRCLAVTCLEHVIKALHMSNGLDDMEARVSQKLKLYLAQVGMETNLLLR